MYGAIESNTCADVGDQTTMDIPDGRLLQVFPLEDSQDNTSVEYVYRQTLMEYF